VRAIGRSVRASFPSVRAKTHLCGHFSICAGNTRPKHRAIHLATPVFRPATVIFDLRRTFADLRRPNGAGSLARIWGASGVCVSQGMIFVADSNNQRIRNITFNASPQPISPANLQLKTFSGLQITGTIGRTYQIQTSPDLNTWTTKATILLNSSPFLWIDQDPVSGNKYYRALMLP
jgi:hypothetical protein